MDKFDTNETKEMINDIIEALRYSADIMRAKENGETLSEEAQKMAFHALTFLSTTVIAYAKFVEHTEIVKGAMNK